MVRNNLFGLQAKESLLLFIVIGMATAIGLFIHARASHIQHTLPQEVMQQRTELAALADHYTLLMQKLANRPTTDASALSSAEHETMLSAIATLKQQQQNLRHHYNFDDLNKASAVYAISASLLADIEHWLQQGLHGHPPNSAFVLTNIFDRLSEGQQQIHAYREQAELVANELIHDHTRQLHSFKSVLFWLLVAFAILSLAVAGLFIQQRITQAKLTAIRKQTNDALNSINDGFALFDKDDKLIVFNQAMARVYPQLSPYLIPGLSFSEWTERAFASDTIAAIDSHTERLWSRDQSAATEVAACDVHLHDDRVFRITEHKTQDHGTVVIHTDISDLKRTQKQLLFQTTHDVLTSLPNRSLFHDRLEHALAQSRRQNHQVAVLVFNLDRFKHINDSYGHAAGDQMLMTIAQRLSHVLRDADTAARLGGDEFAVILESIQHISEAGFIAERILEHLCQSILLGGNEVTISASIGIAIFPNDADQLTPLLSAADVACHHAKALGRDNFQFYSSAMNTQATERMLLEKHLFHALERDELHVHYQPQMDLSNGKIVGMEALLRWHSPELGEVPPERFIPIAEESGLIATIGEWVLRQACLQTAAWREQGLGDIPVMVNVSACQFRLQNLPELVTSVLNESDLGPTSLALEITESAVIDDIDNVINTLDCLNELGINLFIDDFGIGYSSLFRLKRLPLQALKIDRSFVRDIVIDNDALAIVSAIIAMATNLNLKVVAEGVETAEQLNILRDRGCNAIQGFYLSQPVDANSAGFFLMPDLPQDITQRLEIH